MTPSTSRYVGAEVGLRITEVPQEPIPEVRHIDIRREVDDYGDETLHFAEVECACGTSFARYGRGCKLKVQRDFDEHLADENAKPQEPNVADLGIRMCRAGGCVNQAGEGPYCPRCLEEISSLVTTEDHFVGKPLRLSKCIGFAFGVGFVLAAAIYVVIHFARAVWPGGAQ